MAQLFETWLRCEEIGVAIMAETCLSEANISLNVLPSKVVSPGIPIGSISQINVKMLTTLTY